MFVNAEWNPVIARQLRRRRDFLLLFSSFRVYSGIVVVVVTNAVIAVSSLVSGTGRGCCSWLRTYRQNKERKKGWWGRARPLVPRGRVKHSQPWSPHGWVTVTFQALLPL